MTKLGEILKHHGWVSEPALDEALHLHRRQGSRLGETLISLGAIGMQQLHRALAEQHGLTYVNLDELPPDNLLLHQTLSPELCLARGLIPWRRNPSGGIIFAITDPSEATRNWCRRQFGSLSSWVMTSPVDIRRTLQRECGHQLQQASILSLWQRYPSLSARTTAWPVQREILIGFAAAALLFMLIAPWQTMFWLVVGCHLLFAATMLFKSGIFAVGLTRKQTINWPETLASLEESTLPIYTILVPMYREKESLPGMLRALAALDYPASRLDIKLVLEEDDHETYEAACALKPPYHIEIIRVPESYPRTKPKACNYALRFARGEYITIYDADDRPEPLQLKKAVAMFRQLPDDTTCLQARLNYYNASDNLLTRFFCLEYSMLFETLLHGLQKLQIPIPLGGTSNHLSLLKLKQLGEWDPFNVTEDADLGTRLCLQGGKTRMLDSYTLEEAPVRVMPWIRQRGRWIKGYMQTWLVYMRSPLSLYKALGASGFIGFQCFIGLSCLTFLVAPLVWLVALAWLAGAAPEQLPQWLVMLALINLAMNFITHWWMAAVSLLKQPGRRWLLLPGVIFYPLYLLLHSIASYRALWQLLTSPHLWDKTQHGVSQSNQPKYNENEPLTLNATA